MLQIKAHKNTLDLPVEEEQGDTTDEGHNDGLRREERVASCEKPRVTEGDKAFIHSCEASQTLRTARCRADGQICAFMLLMEADTVNLEETSRMRQL